MWFADEHTGKATAFGKSADCPFCLARLQEPIKSGDLVLCLSGPHIGQTGLICENAHHLRPSDFPMKFESRNSDIVIVSTNNTLITGIKNLKCPSWLPKFSLIRAYSIESLVHAFCNDCYIGDNFRWDFKLMAALSGQIWWGRFAISPTELSAIASAHGLPSQFQERFERAFEFGRECLISANGRKPVMKWRDDQAVPNLFSEALRYSYRWRP